MALNIQTDDGVNCPSLEDRMEGFDMPRHKIAAMLFVAGTMLLAIQVPAQSAPLMVDTRAAKSTTANANLVEVRYVGWRGGWGRWGWGAGAFAAGALIGGAIAAPYYYGGYYPYAYAGPHPGYGYYLDSYAGPYPDPGYGYYAYPGYDGSYAGYYAPYRPYYHGWRGYYAW
jgi:hypothetical protein